MPAKIYGLYCPATGELRYIGKADDPETRLKTHLMGCESRSWPCANWLAKLKREGGRPLLMVLASCLSDDWQSVERQVIAQYREAGADLLNIGEGGDQPQRDERRWAFLRWLGGEIRYCKTRGLDELALKLERVRELFKLSSPDTQWKMIERYERKGAANAT